MPSYRELLQQARAEIDEVTSAEAHALVGSGEPPVFLDVRNREEWEEGFIPGAVWIPRGNLESRVEGLLPDRDREVVVYCASGTRSVFATRTLGELGYTHVTNMRPTIAAASARRIRVTSPSFCLVWLKLLGT